MLQAFIVVLREGFEAFLIVAVTLAFFSRVKRADLVPAVYGGTLASIGTSILLGVWLWRQAPGPLWEALSGFVSALLVTGLVLHVWRHARHFKSDMEKDLARNLSLKSPRAVWFGVFFFTVLMISREGMEMVLLLLQIQEPRIVTGIGLGILGALALSLAWVRWGSLLPVRSFFEVTSLYLLLFVIQILIFSFHELTETGLIPAAESLHKATEPFSPEGYYGQWFPAASIVLCLIWLVTGKLRERFSQSRA